jgi:hypothetical protein
MSLYTPEDLIFRFDHSTRLQGAQKKFEREHDWPEYQHERWEDEEYQGELQVQDVKRRRLEEPERRLEEPEGRLEEPEDVDPVLDQGNPPLAQGI